MKVVVIFCAGDIEAIIEKPDETNEMEILNQWLVSEGLEPIGIELSTYVPWTHSVIMDGELTG